MIRTGTATTAAFNPMKEVKTTATAAKDEWEVRPGGMLVQKRTPDSESAVAAAAAPVPTIRVKVKYESAYYEIYLSSQSTFGEVKRLMGERTGLHPREQKIVYKDRERESGAYLDVCGVRDKSKMVMVVDPVAHARRLLETRRTAKSEKAARAIKDISSQVDTLGLQVTDMETTISKGKKVPDKDILSLIEQLMTQLIKLDDILAEGDLKLQRGMQVRRVQKYVETLDVLNIKNAKIATTQQPPLHQKRQQQQPPSSVVVTQEWETFDSLFGPLTPTSTSTSTRTYSSSTAIAPKRFDWELF